MRLDFMKAGVFLALLGLGLAGGCTSSGTDTASTSGGTATGGGANVGAGGTGGGMQSPCPPGHLDTEGGCRTAGLPSDGCAPGEALDEGVCVAAGVRPEGCGRGFVYADHGCTPVTPAAACASGEMALPGETACRPVATCGSGTWGNIPSQANTIYVDASAPSAGADGSMQHPFPVLQDGVDAASAGATVAVAAGAYGRVTIEDKPVQLWGRCPAMVSVADSGAPVVRVAAGADGTRVRGLAITGSNLNWAAVALSGAGQIVFEELWVHDVDGTRGLDIIEGKGTVPTSVTVRGTLVERARVVGIMVWGSGAVIEDTVVRDMVSSPTSGIGRAINVAENIASGTPSTATVRHCRVEGAIESALSSFGATTVIEDTLLRGVQPSAMGDSGDGIGLYARGLEDNLGSLVARRSVIEQVQGHGALFNGTNVTLEDMTIREISPGENQLWGRGLSITGPLEGSPRVTGDVSWSLIDDTHDLGLSVFSADLVARGVRVRRVAPQGAVDSPAPDASEAFGWGIAAASSSFSPDPVTTLDLDGVAIEDTDGDGIETFGASITLERCLVDRTNRRLGEAGVRTSEGNAGPSRLTMRASEIRDARGSGLTLSASEGSVSRSRIAGVTSAGGAEGNGVVIRRGTARAVSLSLVLIENVVHAGVLVDEATAQIEGTMVRDVLSTPKKIYGDGLTVRGGDGDTFVSVDRSRFGGAARAGLSVFGAEVRLRSSLVACSPISLNGEPLNGIEWSLVDEGDNQCGCDDAFDACKVLSTELAPPTAPDGSKDDGRPSDEQGSSI